MHTIRLKVTDLLDPAGQGTVGQAPDLAQLVPLVRKQFAFLPDPLTITIEGDEIVLQFPEESGAAQAEAARLAEKGATRAAAGNYPKAIDAFTRALKLQPSLHGARRDLAMAYMEVGDAENATNHLIEVLRLDPADAWGWVVLGNLYLGPKDDPETGERFLRKALALKPGDAWALNSLAALCQKRGEDEEAVRLFRQAISANPEFANPYFGEAMALASMRRPDDANAVLQRLFKMGHLQDVRTQPVYENARQLHVKVQEQLARRDGSEMFECVQDFRAELETLSGYPIKIEEGEFSDSVSARIQMAWAHGRDYHLITTRRGFPPELLCHLEAHELGHLKIEADARKVGVNRFFSSTPETMASARIALRADEDKLRRAGTPPDAIERLHLSLIKGVCGFLLNCPIDMLIERHLRETFPVLRPSQFLSVRVMAGEALQANTNPEILKAAPRKILRASLAMNGAYSLFLDDLFEGATTFAAPYRKMENFPMAKRLYEHWTGRADQCMGGGREYALVDEFADILGIRDWYEWQPDPGHHEVGAAPRKEGTTNPGLLKKKHPAAVWFLLSALERYDKLPPDKVREITFEVALVGQRGLDYSSPDKKYTLSSIPGQDFSGLELMCLMHAGFKRLEPGMDTGMDLDDPFLTALELFQQKEGGGS